jgi:excisionase family DNA binding protein
MELVGLSGWMTTRRAAELKGVSRQTVFNAARAGLITSTRLDRRYFVRRDAAFDAWSPMLDVRRRGQGRKRGAG